MYVDSEMDMDIRRCLAEDTSKMIWWSRYKETMK
jgi:hypothetical protein